MKKFPQRITLYRLELVSGNKLQKIFTICHNARIPYLILPVWFPLPLSVSPFPAAPWGCRHCKKDPISTVKTL